MSGKRDGRSLIKILETQVVESESQLDEVGEQRERNHRYYTIQKFGNERRGGSHHVSADVFDAVEAKKAFFKETFFSGRKPVKIVPGATGSQDEADQRTAYANQVLRRNDWEGLCRDGWHDAFVAKRMIVFCEWSPEESQEEIEVQGLTAMHLQQAAQQNPRLIDINPVEGVIENVVIAGQQMQVFSGTLEQTLDESKVAVRLIQPERYYRDGNVANVIDGMFVGFSEEIPRAELIKRKYDPEQVAELKTDYRFGRQEEEWARKSHDGSARRRQRQKRQKEQQEVTVYRTWTWIDLSEYDEAFNRQPNPEIDPESLVFVEIHWACGELLRYADGSPAMHEREPGQFHEYTEYKISHAEHGMSTADVLASTQRTKSTLKRLIVDNQVRVNTSRYEAKRNSLKNPRELLEGHVGGVIWSNDGQSVRALEQPLLSPLTFNTLEMLDREKEERGAPSRLSQGLNTDAVRYQNADNMIERLTDAANKRTARAARDFACFIGQVMNTICIIAQRHDQMSYQMEIAGKQVMVSPSNWRTAEYEYEVQTALTPEEGVKYAQVLLTMDAQKTLKAQQGREAGDPSWAIMYGAEQQHALFDDVYDALGVADTSRYMLRPDSPQYQQAMMMHQQQQMMMQQAMQQQQMAQHSLLERNVADAERRTMLEGLKTQSDIADTYSDNERADRQLAQDKVLKLEELKVRRSSGGR